jgi:putative FmdB family regulatory protein
VPIYEYVCEQCGRPTEVMQRMSDPPLKICPECGAPKLARAVSRTSFQLKGGGWYSDLYASPKKKPEGAAPGSGSAPAGGSGTGTGSSSGGGSGSGSGGGSGSGSGGSSGSGSGGSSGSGSGGSSGSGSGGGSGSGSGGGSGSGSSSAKT